MPTEKPFAMSARDMKRLYRVMRWVEDHASMFNSYRRIRGQRAGSGGISFIWATVIRGLLYPDPARTEGPVEGYSQYILRLDSSSYTAWALMDGAEYAEYNINDLRTNDGFLYQCTTPHTATEDSEPGTGANWESYWGLSTEITALPIGQETELGEDEIDYYATLPDMRHFVPWYQVGDSVPLILRDGHYFFVETMTRTINVAGDSVQSIKWNDTDHRIMSVYG